MIRRVLVPLDGSLLAERALLVAGNLVESLAGTLVVARVVAPRPDGRYYRAHLVQELIDAETREAQGYLASTAERLRNDRLIVETVLLHGEVTAELLAAVEREHCDLIAMSSHGMSGLGSHVFGSVAQQLLHAASCPVLVVRSTPDDLEREEEQEERATDSVLLGELSTPTAGGS